MDEKTNRLTTDRPVVYVQGGASIPDRPAGYVQGSASIPDRAAGYVRDGASIQERPAGCVRGGASIPDRPVMLLLAGFLAAVLAGPLFDAPTAGRAYAAAKKGDGFGRVLRLEGAASRGFYQDLKRTLSDLQSEAETEGVDAYLVLEINKGPSTFGDVSDVADLLGRVSSDYPRVTTVAWIPKDTTVTGFNAIVALACRNIIMHPNASLGDISEGGDVTGRQRELVKEVIRSSNNPKVNEALGMGLLDRGVEVLKVTVKTKKDVRETKIVTREELRKLRAGNVAIPDQDTIKEPGVAGLISGRSAHSQGVLVVTTRQSLDDVARFYEITLRRAVAAGKKDVALIKVEGVINPMLESFLTRQIERCEQMGKNVIIFEITSPGGYLSSSMNLSQKIADLNSDKIRTVAYVHTHALSGAAIIAFGCDEIYMTPDSKIGDAGPIEIARGQQFERAPEKILSVLKVHLRSLAEKKKRPPALLEAMADHKLVVYRVTHPQRSPTYMSQEELNRNAADGWVKGPPVPESKENNLLTVSGKRAVELKLATAVIEGEDRDTQLKNLKSELGLDPNLKLVALQPTWVDTLVFWLNDGFVTVALLVIAIICIYLETHFMTGILGIISVLCFALFFWSRFLGGTAGWLEVILFVLGLGCIVMEIFVIPGFGVFGISGGLLIISSLVLASQTFGNLEPNADYQLLAGTMGRLAISIVLVVALAVTLSRYLPNVPLFGKLVLTPPGFQEAVADGPQLRPEALDERAALIGQYGRTESVLRPAGKAVINGRMYDVVSDGPYIAEGSEIVVVSASGNKIVVRSA